MKRKTFDEEASEYMKRVTLSKGTYKGDVETAFAEGMQLQGQRLGREITSLKQELERVKEILRKGSMHRVSLDDDCPTFRIEHWDLTDEQDEMLAELLTKTQEG